MYRFRECREAAGLEQKQVAISLKIKPPSVSDWENGKSKPTIENLIKFAALCHVTVDELLGLAAPSTSERMTADEHQLLQEYRGAEPTYRGVAHDVLRQHQIKNARAEEAS